MSMMKFTRRRVATFLLAAAVAGLPFVLAADRAQPVPHAPPAPRDSTTKPADVPVRAVVLFSSGVGYFEHSGTVDGDTSTELRFKTNQINDILKSLVLEDVGGKVGVISYPSQNPIAKTLRSFQIDITGNPGLGELLNQLRGAKVRLGVGGENLEGTILGLEKKEIAVGKEKGTIQVWQLNLVLADGTIRSVELAGVTGIKLEDAQLQEEMNKALLALAQARDQDKKPVTIHFQGKGQRRVRLGYVVETPVWKTSYRLILSDGPKGAKDVKGGADGSRLQGWAIVENQTDNDWNNVELSLVSGRPISFVQDLYHPLYVPRPFVQTQLYESLRPQTYEGGMDEKKGDADKPGQADDKGGADDRGRAFRELQKRLRGPGSSAGGSGGGSSGLFGSSRSNDGGDDGPMDPAASVASVASAEKVGELFEYTVGSVSLPRQRSAMLPIVTDPIEVEKLSIYNQSVLARNPLNGARVKNTTGKHLLAGPVTVLDGGRYAGDASIDNLPPGQERLVSYGIDLQVLVDATNNSGESNVLGARIVKGVLYLNQRTLITQEYAAQNKGDHDKELVIEHPFRPGAKLVEGGPDFVKPYETTDTLYRFRRHVPAGKSARLVVREESVQEQGVAILQTDVTQLQTYLTNNPLGAPVKDALAQAIALKSGMVDTSRQITEAQQRVSAITAEQGRIRENMKTVDKAGPYYNRLLAKLNDQETQFEKLNDDLDALKKKLATEQKALEDYAATLNIDGAAGK